MIKIRQQTGLSLIEVLVTILIMALGMVGVVFFTASAMHATSANHARSSAIQALTQFLEPIVNDVDLAADTAAALAVLKTDLTKFVPTSGTAVCGKVTTAFVGGASAVASNDNGKDSYKLAIQSIINGDGATSTGVPATLIFPVTAIFAIPYTNATGGTQTICSSYSFHWVAKP